MKICNFLPVWLQKLQTSLMVGTLLVQTIKKVSNNTTQENFNGHGNELFSLVMVLSLVMDFWRFLTYNVFSKSLPPYYFGFIIFSKRNFPRKIYYHKNGNHFWSFQEIRLILTFQKCWSEIIHLLKKLQFCRIRLPFSIHLAFNNKSYRAISCENFIEWFLLAYMQAALRCLLFQYRTNFALFQASLKLL